MKVPYFNKNQRAGILALVGIIIILQGLIFAVRNMPDEKHADFVLDEAVLREIDSLKMIALKKNEIRSFNPNFITNDRAFKLGMSAAEMNRLLEFRAKDKYVNSAEEFQKVTGISDSLLMVLKPHFKFPEWTQQKRNDTPKEKPVLTKIDLNKATYDDLIAVKGIGDYFANVVLSEREKLGGFVSVEQLNYIKGLRAEAVVVLKQSVVINQKPKIIKVNVNTATREEIAKVPYVTPQIAREIVVLRSKKDEPLKIEDLEKISAVSLDKLKIIGLYLEF